MDCGRVFRLHFGMPQIISLFGRIERHLFRLAQSERGVSVFIDPLAGVRVTSHMEVGGGVLACLVHASRYRAWYI